MIELQNISKAYPVRGGEKVVANNISVTLPAGRSIALLGRNGAGKSSLLRMIAGSMKPDSGEVRHTGSVSWPVGFAGSFHKDLTGAQNVRFVGRVYGVDTRQLIDFVEDFAELGGHFHMPVRTYSSGMKSRLAFGVSMGIHFDTYLVDEVTAVGDRQFKKKCRQIFNARMVTSGAVVVSHSMRTIRRLCDAGMVLENGELTWFDDLEAAIAWHEALMV